MQVPSDQVNLNWSPDATFVVESQEERGDEAVRAHQPPPLSRQRLPAPRRGGGRAPCPCPASWPRAGAGRGSRGRRPPRLAPRPSSRSSQTRSPVSNWPFYIDQNDDATSFPTLDQFTEATGVKVDYLEDINSNEVSAIQAPLSRGQSIDRDIIVPTAWMCARLLDLGYLQQIDERDPEHGHLEELAQAQPASIQPRLQPAWQTYITAVGLDPERSGARSPRSSSSSTRPQGRGCHDAGRLRGRRRLFLLEMGEDPADFDFAAYDEVIARSRRRSTTAVPSVHRQGLRGLLAGGDITCMAWSGDVVVLQADNPNLEFTIPDAGGMTSVDTMVVPHGRTCTASTFVETSSTTRRSPPRSPPT